MTTGAEMDSINNFIIQLISSATVVGAVAAILTFGTKTWLSERIKGSIKSEYDEKLETHKAQLKAQSDTEIERLRSQLRAASLEHEVRFSRLHEKRAEVIAETHALLRALYSNLSNYVKLTEWNGEPSKQEYFTALVKAHDEFRNHYTTRLIFFPKITATKLSAINTEFVRTANEFRLMVEPKNTQNSTEKWVKLDKRVSQDINTSLEELETEFRRLLGDHS